MFSFVSKEWRGGVVGAATWEVNNNSMFEITMGQETHSVIAANKLDPVWMRGNGVIIPYPTGNEHIMADTMADALAKTINTYKYHVHIHSARADSISVELARARLENARLLAELNQNKKSPATRESSETKHEWELIKLKSRAGLSEKRAEAAEAELHNLKKNRAALRSRKDMKYALITADLAAGEYSQDKLTAHGADYVQWLRSQKYNGANIANIADVVNDANSATVSITLEADAIAKICELHGMQP